MFPAPHENLMNNPLAFIIGQVDPPIPLSDNELTIQPSHI